MRHKDCCILQLLVGGGESYGTEQDCNDTRRSIQIHRHRQKYPAKSDCMGQTSSPAGWQEDTDPHRYA